MGKSLILELHNKIINNQIDITSIIKQVESKQKEIGTTNSIITSTINLVDANKLQQLVNENKDNLLFGIPYSLKDNFSTKDILTTGGSLILSNYIPPYSCSVYEMLSKTNAILTAKVALDEFGLGATGTYCHTGIVKNHYDNARITAGSSSGSVNAVACGVDLFSLGTDTGDSVRRPSSFLGVVGYKPSYGIISRYGVLPYSPSLDHVGIIANYVTDIAIVADCIVNADQNDLTSQKITKDFYKNLNEVKTLKINVIKDIQKYLQADVAKLYDEAIVKIKEAAHTINEIEVNWEIIKAISPVYRIITYAEANSCYANMTGIPFGTNFDQNITGYYNIIKNNRTKGFGKQVKRRFTIGAYITKHDNYEEIFRKARKLRTLMVYENDVLLKDADAYILPGASSVAPLLSDVENNKFTTTLADDILELSNFAGSPSITIPYAFESTTKMPFGININTKQYEDQKVFNIALTLENIFNFNKENR